MERIKFFGTFDATNRYMLSLIKSKLLMNISTFVCNINDAIELYNITLFFDVSGKPASDDQLLASLFRDKKKQLQGSIARMFNKVQDVNLSAILQSLERFYIVDFWKLFGVYKLYRKVQWETINLLLNEDIIRLEYLLREKNIVKAYGMELKDRIIQDIHAIELLTYNMTISSDDRCVKYYFPDCMDENDYFSAMKGYIESENAEHRCLLRIINCRDFDKLKGNALEEIKHIARLRRSNIQRAIIEEDMNIFPKRTEVIFMPSCEIETVKDASNDTVIYDINWIYDNLDYPTLLNNFIYLFNFANIYFQIELYSRFHEASCFERVSSRLKTDYFVSETFIRKNALADLELLLYSDILNERSIEIEAVIEWYYVDYLKNEYNIGPFQISLPRKTSNTYERCKSIAPEIESIIRQFCSYCKNGYIDFDYIASSYNPTSFKDIPSLVKTKYIYPTEETQKILNVLFSDQSILSYIPKQDKGERNFFFVVDKHNPIYEEFDDCQRIFIDQLIELKFLTINSETGVLSFAEPERINMLFDMFIYGYVNKNSSPQGWWKHLDAMILSNQVIVKSSLLSTQEASYFNYVLNSSEYGNSMDLRNKYLHGIRGPNEKAELINYYRFLKILILLTMKIENDIQIQFLQSRPPERFADILYE